MPKFPMARHVLASGSLSVGLSQSRFSAVFSQVLNAVSSRMGGYIRLPRTLNPLNESRHAEIAGNVLFQTCPNQGHGKISQFQGAISFL